MEAITEHVFNMLKLRMMRRNIRVCSDLLTGPLFA